MSEDRQILERYFTMPPGYFWNWAEKMEVIEWGRKDTICYREELSRILKELAPQGLPPFGAILLALAACKNNAPIDKAILLHILQDDDEEDTVSVSGALMPLFEQVLTFLQLISQLPQEFRTGNYKPLLLQAVFETPRVIEPSEAVGLLTTFNSGELDEPARPDVPFDPGYLYHLPKLLTFDLEAFQTAADKYKTTDQLLQQLRTGLSQLPREIPIALPVPTPAEKDLLTELEEDENTAGLTRLTQRVMAAFKIPMHAQGSSDQSFGGVSDITNRGNFDRLLLSELAYDDELLMARLANNEALYLRREELPSQSNREWNILIDTTLTMWGLPRVFAMAGALACTQNLNAQISLQAFTLGGNSAQPADLLTKTGIVNALEKTDPALHCGQALLPLLVQQPRDNNTSFFLITNEDTLIAPYFQEALATLYQYQGFIITTNRDGQLYCYELVNGRRKQIAHALFDLEALLFPPPPKPKIKKSQQPQLRRPLPAGPRTSLPLEEWPAVFHEDTFPLRFPASKVILNGQRVYKPYDDNVLAITKDQRLLYWDDKGKGAHELSSFVEPGNYYWGHNQQDIYLLAHVAEKNELRLYKFSLKHLKTEYKLLDVQAPEIEEAVFYINCFFVRTANGTFSINVGNFAIRHGEHLSETVLEAIRQRNTFTYEKRIHIRNFINNGYSVLNSIDNIGIDRDGQLIIHHRLLQIDRYDRIWLSDDTEPASRIKYKATQSPEAFCLPFNEQVKMQVFIWPDGSKAIVDGRGFLHLKSADKEIEEISLTLVLEKDVACSLGAFYCGNPYFIRGWSQTPEKLSGKTFFNQPLRQFIDSIIQHATRTTA